MIIKKTLGKTRDSDLSAGRMPGQLDFDLLMLGQTGVVGAQYLQHLRAAGLIEESGDRIVATTDGKEALGDNFEPLPTGPDLLAHWRKELSIGERRILDAIVDAYPNAIDKEDIDTATSYKRSSRDTYLQRLRSRRLVVDAGGGQVRAAEELF